ncbi:MAG TPA: S8 family serine peptidase [Propionicimonas sp.]|uniref:S8 family serine peptidase n=1 Tax=Propionicimonas sp. TaxID=1955623 RepID=UPI002F42C026
MLSHTSRAIRTGLGVGLAVAALVSTALAVPADADPLDRTGKDLTSRAVPEELKGKALPDTWFVQVSGAPSLRGGSRTAAKSRQAGVQDAARNDGVKLAVLHSYTRVWNGFSVKASRADVERLRTLPGVTAIYPVFPVALPDRKVEPDLKYSLPMIGADVAQVEGYAGDGVKVGVIDTGIDYNHPDLGGSGTPGNNADFGPGAPRVRYGYDFVGDDYDADVAGSALEPDAFPDDCNGHGTHVSGIIGANGDPASGHARGVAPHVTFGAYRVFGCDGSADTEVILAAMDRAAADEMDVVNMSLGDAFATWPDYPDAAAADALTDAGTLVVASAGNSGESGLFSSGSPGVGKKVISVASVENTNITLRYFSATPVPAGTDGHVGYVPAEGAPLPPDAGSTPLAVPPGDNTQGCDPLAGLAGTIALVQRGTCSFYQKAYDAQLGGAAGVVIYNNAPGILSPTVVGAQPITIPVVFVGQDDGEALAGQVNSAATNLTWTTETEASPNPAAGLVSDFSSFGMAADLSLTPDVAAPGGNIWSTFPIEQKSYANLSGTSMAAPHVAGSVALLLQAARLANLDLDGDVSAVRSALQNTAKPISTLFQFGQTAVPGVYEPTVRQGAGLIQIDKAIAQALTATTVSPGKISVGENRSRYYKKTLKLTNHGTKTEKYTLSVQNAAAVGPGPTTFWYDYSTRKVKAKFSAKSVTVKPHRTAKVAVYLKQPSLKPGWLYGGWVTFTTSDKSTTLVVPFGGIYGDYQKVKVLQDAWDVNSAGTALEVVADLPALATSGDVEDIVAPTDPKPTFTLTDAAHSPHLLFHFDYPVSNAVFNVYKATATGKKGATVFPGHTTFLELGEFGRDDGFLDLPFDGKIPFSNTTAAGLTVPNGDYVLELRVLKALGRKGTSGHWETYVSPAFTIHRTTP